MRQYRAAIVGLSWISADPAGVASHPVLGTAIPYSHASAYAATPGVTVVAGCDIAQASCDNFRERWQSTWPELRTYADYREMLAREQIDLVSVVTPDHLHVAVLEAAAAAGVRGVFCEKPMATSLADADEMIRLVKEHGVAMTVNYTRRWLPEFVAARERIRQGAIGKVAQVHARFGGARAMLFRNHTHVLDLISFFAESDPDWLVAELEQGFADYGTTYRGEGGRDPSRDPGANAYIAYKNGIRAFFGGMKHALEEMYVQVIGETGRVEIAETGATLVLKTDAGQVLQPIRPSYSRGGMQAAVADLIHAVETGEPTQSPPEEARKAVALTAAILESQAGGNIPARVR
jgi:predicted dehydrogenase